MAKNKIFSSLIDNKRESSGLIMTSVLVAVGVNMLSTGIVDLLELRFGFQIKEVILITIGIFLSLGVLAWNAWTNFRRLNQTKKFEGFIIYDETIRLSAYQSIRFLLIWLSTNSVHRPKTKHLRNCGKKTT